MNKLYIVDTDIEFQELLSQVCANRGGKLETRSFSSCLEIFAALKDEPPALLFLSLDMEDLDEFVMYDLLKKTSVTYSVPVLITYTDQSEQELSKYESLKFKAEGYFKKPLGPEDIGKMLDTFIKTVEVEEPVPEVTYEDSGTKDRIDLPGIEPPETEADRDDNEFSDENIDLLVRGQLVETEQEQDKPKVLMEDTKHELMLDLGDSVELDQPGDEPGVGDIGKDFGKDFVPDAFDLGLTEEPQTNLKPPEENKNEKSDSRGDRELAVQIIALESQNEFLRTENKELSKNLEQARKDIKQHKADLSTAAVKIEKKEQEHQALAEQLKKKLEDVTGEFEGFQVKEQTESNNLVRKVEVLEEHTAKLQDEKSELTRRLHDMDSEKQILGEALEALKKQFEELNGQLNNLQQEKIQIENEKGELDTKIQDMSNETMELNRQLLALNDEKASLQTLVENITNEKQTIQQMVLEANQKEESARGELAEKERQNNELTTKINDQEKQLVRLKDEQNKLKQEYDDLNHLTSGLEELKTGLEARVEELSNSLTDKERELVARNHQFEVHLKNKLDEVLQENEERLRAEFKRREDSLMQQLQQVSDERQLLEDRINNDVASLKEETGKLLAEREELQKREDSLNRTCSNLAEEKVALSERVLQIEEELAERERMFQKEEENYKAKQESLKNEIEDMRRRADFYKDRIADVGELLNKAHSLTQTGNNGQNGQNG